MNRAPTSVFIPPIRREGDQSGLGINYEDSESEHLSQESNTGEDMDESNIEEESDESNTDEETDDESNKDEETDDEIFNSDDDDDEDDDDDVDAETLQKIKIGESVINLITVILPYLNELK